MASSYSNIGLKLVIKRKNDDLISRITDETKQWKLSPMDIPALSEWYKYSKARDIMFEATDTDMSPWHIVHSDDQKRATLNCISHILEQIPY